MAALTRRYQQATGRDLTSLPLRDLDAALRALRGLSGFGLDAQTEARFRRRLNTFIRAALARF